MQKKKYYKISALIGQNFGLQILKYLKKNKILLDTLIIDTKYKEKDKLEIIRSKIAKNFFFANDKFNLKIIKFLKDSKFEQCLSFWWPYILRKDFLCLFKYGVINCHASYLPFERGLYSYVHSIRNQHPKGVTLHFMDKLGKVDLGKIIYQKKLIAKDFINGYELEKILYLECLKLYKTKMKDLLNQKFNFTKLKKIKKTPQNFRKNLDKVTFVDLNKKYLAGDLIYTILSRSGFKKGGAHFKYKNKRYEMNLKIRKKNK